MRSGIPNQLDIFYIMLGIHEFLHSSDEFALSSHRVNIPVLNVEGELGVYFYMEAGWCQLVTPIQILCTSEKRMILCHARGMNSARDDPPPYELC